MHTDPRNFGWVDRPHFAPTYCRQHRWGKLLLKIGLVHPCVRDALCVQRDYRKQSLPVGFNDAGGVEEDTLISPASELAGFLFEPL